MRGIEYFRKKLNMKRTRVLLRYRYYEQKQSVRDFSTIPANMAWLKSTQGWCTKAVDSLADRLQFRGFRDDNFYLEEIFQMNNPDVLFPAAIRSALISACCFIYISLGEDEYPRLQVIDGANATGEIDPITGLLKEGYAVLERDQNTELQETEEYSNTTPKIEAYFTPEETVIYRKDEGTEEHFPHNAGFPLLVPIIHRPDDVRPFGHSRISRTCMSLVDSAARTVRQMEVSAEYYSFPQKYVTGLSQDAEKMDKWKATMSTFLSFTKDEDGESPKLGQFQQQNMSPYSEELRTLAALFAGETGLTMDDIGFVTENPSSAEAIKASHENLRLAAKAAQRSFGSGFLNAGYLAACLRDDFPYKRKQLYLTTPIWEPVFEPDAAMLSSIGDGAIKLNQAVPDYITAETMQDLTGIKGGRA